MALTVSQVARLAKISIRTLHHYDEIGLLKPSGRSEAGYRLYETKDLQRLQQVRFFKELGFPLEEIIRVLNDPDFDLRAALKSQRRLLLEKTGHLQALVRAVDAALDSIEKGTPMPQEEMFEVFGDFDPSKYEDEVHERWGNTEAYRESAKRTSGYTRKDWEQLKAEGDELQQRMAAQLAAGTPPTDEGVMDLAEQHRQYISRWFYPCSHEMHGGLGELYVSDSRFTQNIDRVRPGLAQFTQEAFQANAARALGQ
ncbi:MerR family transcriptional regulator [Stigmatella sp. ncwal1]|uniref:MerR family transcriptional regulator n=1 Tax=Stigmatella ashevillensis TaxID=2995309 RepID=A0ABT5DHH2_9BACT|nr:MerR family transcriptional regulator [Stigmatella ashevillena]MDC0712971.1 MerR family transcriptional regulator [Stigmatella ashevillena]